MIIIISNKIQSSEITKYIKVHRSSTDLRTSDHHAVVKSEMQYRLTMMN